MLLGFVWCCLGVAVVHGTITIREICRQAKQRNREHNEPSRETANSDVDTAQPRRNYDETKT